jgi:hypothetical protein
MQRTFAPIGLLLLFSGTAFAQAQPAPGEPLPTFDLADVHPSPAH